jgi:hypothetical protein
MATVRLTLTDTENGGVKVDSTPHPQQLAKIARGGDLTPAEGYALAALAKIIKDSQENLRLEMKDKFDRGIIPAYEHIPKLQ